MTTQYMYLSAEVQQQLHSIKRKIYLKMNGVTAEQMEKIGVFYSKNYGVSLSEIKHLSEEYSKDGTLAQALWYEKIRETMLVATFLYPEADFDAVRAEEWVSDVSTLELAENLSRNLLCHLPFVGVKAVEWVRSDNYWKCAIGFFCAAFGWNNLSLDQKQGILLQVKQNRHINEVVVYRAMALFLRKQGSVNPEDAKTMLSFVDCFAASSNRAERYIYEEVQTDLKYRFDI
jgi:3-methyladenine DNA glycosylase AlkD